MRSRCLVEVVWRVITGLSALFTIEVALKSTASKMERNDSGNCFTFRRMEMPMILNEFPKTSYSCTVPMATFSRFRKNRWFYSALVQECSLELANYATLVRNSEECIVEMSRSGLLGVPMTIQTSDKKIITVKFRDTTVNRSALWLTTSHQRHFISSLGGASSMLLDGDSVLALLPFVNDSVSSQKTEEVAFLTLGSRHNADVGSATSVQLANGNLTIARNTEDCEASVKVASRALLKIATGSNVTVACSNTNFSIKSTARIASTGEFTVEQMSGAVFEDSKIVMEGTLFLFDGASLSVRDRSTFLHIAAPIPRLDLISSRVIVQNQSLLRIMGSIDQVKNDSFLHVANDSQFNLESHTLRLDRSKILVTEQGLLNIRPVSTLLLRRARLAVTAGATVELPYNPETAMHLTDAQVRLHGNRTLFYLMGTLSLKGDVPIVHRSSQRPASLHLSADAEMVLRRASWSQFARSRTTLADGASVLCRRGSEMVLEASAHLQLYSGATFDLGSSAAVTIGQNASVMLANAQLILSSRSELQLEADSRLGLMTNSRLSLGGGALVRIRGACEVVFRHGSSVTLRDRATLLFRCDGASAARNVTLFYSKTSLVLPEFSRTMVDLRNCSESLIHLDRIDGEQQCRKVANCDLSELMRSGKC